MNDSPKYTTGITRREWIKTAGVGLAGLLKAAPSPIPDSSPAGVPENAVYLDTGERGEQLWLSIDPPKGDRNWPRLHVWCYMDNSLTGAAIAFKDYQDTAFFFSYRDPTKKASFKYTKDNGKLLEEDELLKQSKQAIHELRKLSKDITYEDIFVGFPNNNLYGNSSHPLARHGLGEKEPSAILIDKGKYGEYIWMQADDFGDKRQFTILVIQGATENSKIFIPAEYDSTIVFKGPPDRKTEIPVNDLLSQDPKWRMLPVDALRKMHGNDKNYKDMLSEFDLYKGIDTSKSIPAGKTP